ncbi:hypothetical protein [Sorangium sp. So ce406]|uniref:hypothetical protein n=1 Tax=Sorangium sp. So ce406 TaxID=3133311 RepID=UPI003F5B5D5E
MMTSRRAPQVLLDTKGRHAAMTPSLAALTALTALTALAPALLAELSPRPDLR